MAFLGHLCILASGLVLLGFFIAYPRSTTFIAITLAMGFIGSSEGFFGTVLGLLIGAGLGGIGAGIAHGVSLLFSPAAKQKNGSSTATGEKENIHDFMRRRDAEEAAADARARQPPSHRR
ncbi:hypothetical protein [Myxococcus vastator]|uniref:hypothetical protein n=1 Tax=Myxococcus vastator TaxID=2709664 RepID=UPI0013D32AC0|nr:hypothetical protein [Myxococcus vastator]